VVSTFSWRIMGMKKGTTKSGKKVKKKKKQ